MNSGSKLVLCLGVLGIAVTLAYRAGSQPQPPAPRQQTHPAQPRQWAHAPQPPHKQPKHKFEFRIVYEGDGLVDDSIVNLTEAYIRAALAEEGVSYTGGSCQVAPVSRRSTAPADVPSPRTVPQEPSAPAPSEIPNTTTLAPASADESVPPNASNPAPRANVQRR